MNKNTVCRVFVVSIIFLVSLSPLTILDVNAQEEPVTPNPALILLTEISNLDITKYNPELTEITGDPAVIQHIKYTLNSDNSKINASFTVKNNNLIGFTLYPDQGEPFLTQQSTNILNEAKNVLDKYQTYSAASYIQPIRDLLSTVTDFDFKNLTWNTIKLKIVDSEDNYLTFQWMNTFYSFYNDYSKVILRFNDKGLLVQFWDSWDIYTLANYDLKISRDEAIHIAKDATSGYSYNVGDILVDDFAIVDDPLSVVLDLQPREGYVLYPGWSIHLYFDKKYPGQVTGLHVTMWADTGDITGYWSSCYNVGRYWRYNRYYSYSC